MKTKSAQKRVNVFRNFRFAPSSAIFCKSKSSETNGSSHHNFHHRRSAGFTSDFNNRDDSATYYQAMKMLKVAVSNLYLSLQQLRGFKQLNYTVMRKIVKKLDKQLCFKFLDQYFEERKSLKLRTSGYLDEIMQQCEYLYASNFTMGNQRSAVNTLNIHALSYQEVFDNSVLITGVALDASIPLIILALYAA